MAGPETSKRAEFREATKRALALRAAFRCSNPGCGALTIGPGTGIDDVEITGTAAHIYAAAAGGPRGTGGLTFDQRRNPLNGIWLCAKCGRLVDTNTGNAYPVPLLRAWRDLHEARTRMDHGGISRPFGWIHSMEILEDVWLAEPTTLRFSRCNMFVGANGIGKSHLVSLMSGFTAPSVIMDRARRPLSPVHAAITWYDPHPHRAEFRAEGESLRFLADGAEVPFVPQPYRVISVPNWSSSVAREITWLAQMLGLDVWTTKKLALSVPDIVGGSVKRVSFVGTGVAARIKAEYIHGGEVIADEGGRGRRLSPIVGMEILIALAETHALAAPTLLLIDGSLASLDAEAFDHLTTLLSSPARGFQTVATLPISARPLNPEWTVTRFVSEPNVRRRNGEQATARLVQDGASV